MAGLSILARHLGALAVISATVTGACVCVKTAEAQRARTRLVRITQYVVREDGYPQVVLFANEKVFDLFMKSVHHELAMTASEAKMLTEGTFKVPAGTRVRVIQAVPSQKKVYLQIQGEGKLSGRKAYAYSRNVHRTTRLVRVRVRSSKLSVSATV